MKEYIFKTVEETNANGTVVMRAEMTGRLFRCLDCKYWNCHEYCYKLKRRIDPYYDYCSFGKYTENVES